MIIINKGKTVVEGYVKDLLDSGSLKVKFEVDNFENTNQVINNSTWREKLTSNSDTTMFFSITKDEIAELNKFLVQNNIMVSAVVPIRSLEEYFLSITEGNE